MDQSIQLVVDDEHARKVCKVGHGAETCRYLSITPKGWSCEKHSDLARLLDQRVAAEIMNARGDNCPGRASR